MSVSVSESTTPPKKKNLRQHSGIRYSKDLTSYQLWTILNNLLYEAAAPLCAYGSMSIEAALSSLALSTNNRRRIAYPKQDVLMQQLFYELAQRAEPINNNPDSRLDLLEYLINQGIERNILVDHIAYALQTSTFPAFLDKRKLHRHISSYLDQFETFKRDIVFRYYYLIQTFANYNWHNKSKAGLASSKEDMFHVYIISAMHSINKFIPFKGTITDYIKKWFQNAEGSSSFIVYDGEAFSLNRNIRKSIQDGDRDLNNKAIPIHDVEFGLKDEDAVTDISIFPDLSRHIAKLPNASLVFLATNIPFHLSKEHRQRIEQHNTRMLQGEPS